MPLNSVIGAGVTIPFSLIAFGQQSIPSGLASILNATTPIFTVIIAHLFTRDERMTPARVVGVLLGFAGIVVMIGPDALVEATEKVPGREGVRLVVAQRRLRERDDELPTPHEHLGAPLEEGPDREDRQSHHGPSDPDELGHSQG